MSQHTPGPWTAEKRKDRKIREWVIRAPGDFPCISYELASLSGYDPIHDKPNAHLIAAAPDLLDASMAAYELLKIIHDETGKVGAQLRNAIAKATGEAA